MSAEVVTFDAGLADRRCIILLGEPGLGKSTEIKAYFDRAAEDEPGQHQFLDLADMTDAHALDSALTRATSQWEDRSQPFTLWLDAIDELSASVPRATRIVGQSLRALGAAPIRARLAGRTAEWPEDLSGSLVDSFGFENVVTCDLEPLNREDVAAEARVAGLNATEFGHWVEDVGAASLAERPITLRFLIEEFRAKTPEVDLWRLFDRAMLRLATDPRASARDEEWRADSPGTTPDSRLSAASRIAAIGQLSARRLVVARPTMTDPIVGTELPLQLLSTRTDARDTDLPTTTPAEVKSALRTALFAGAPNGALRFAHQTYAEFLSARYLVGLRLDERRLFRLLGVKTGALSVSAHRREIVAWVARRDARVFRHLCDTQPEILLGSDIALSDPAAREQVTTAWLDAIRRKRVSLWAMPRFSDCRRLLHPRMEQQLLPVLKDRSEPEIVRRTAVEIAGESQSDGLMDQLVSIALDDQESAYLRSSASHEIKRHGDLRLRTSLAPLLNLPKERDPDDELRGDALTALFPEVLGWQDILPHLHEPQRSNLVGTYRMFLHRLGDAAITRADLDLLLPWLVDKVPDRDWDRGLRRLAARILAVAWEHVEDPLVTSRLAAALLAAPYGYSDLLWDREQLSLLEKIAGDPERRGILLAKTLEVIAASGGNWTSIVFHQPQLLRPGELGLLLRVVPLEAPPAVRRIADEITARFLWNATPTELELACQRAHGDAVFAKTRTWLAGSLIAGPEADAAREELGHQREIEERERERERALQTARDEYAARVRDALTRASGDTGDWHRFCHLLTWPPDERPSEVTTILEELPGWSLVPHLDEETVARAASVFLFAFTPSDNENYITRGTSRSGDSSWMFALRWILRHKPGSHEQLDSSLWMRGAGLIWGHHSDRELLSDDLRQAVRMTIREAEGAACDAIERRLRKGSSTAIRQLLKVNWTQAVETVVRRVAFSADDQAASAPALRILLDRRDADAWGRVANWITDAESQGGSRDSAVVLASEAFEADPARAWPLIKPALAHVELGRCVMEALVDSPRVEESQLWDRLPEAELADLYVWLRRNVSSRGAYA